MGCVNTKKGSLQKITSSAFETRMIVDSNSTSTKNMPISLDKPELHKPQKAVSYDEIRSLTSQKENISNNQDILKKNIMI